MQRRTPSPVSQASLEKSALWHLARRALTEAQLVRVLERKIARAPEVKGVLDVPALLDKLRHLGFLADARVAEARAVSLRARGGSRRKIAERLRRDGVPAALAAAVISGQGGEEAELAAALTWVRKRRLLTRDPHKALAALARQGFSFHVAKRALAAAASHG